MLKQFNSNNRKITKPVPKNIKGNTLDNDAYIAYLESIAEAEYAEHNTEIEKISSKSRKNPNQKQIINNKTTISDFYKEILENSAKQIEKGINDFSNVGFGSLIIYSSSLDYGTEGASPNNFEVLVYGLQIPGNYSINEIGNNVVITLNSNYIDFDNVTINNISVRGKFKQ